MSNNKDSQLELNASSLIPAGCHTYSKGDDQFPGNAPSVIVKGSGSHCWDDKGTEFIDWGMGLRSVILGHAFEPVLDAVREQLLLGSNFTRPSPIEALLAQELISLIPCAEMCKFAKNGSDVTTAATRLARAYTGRKFIARCSDNPFFSFDDWFIGTTSPNGGIPPEISNLTLQFRYNDLSSLEVLFQEYPDQIACVIMEPVSTVQPNESYLQQVKRLTHQNGAVLIFDEIISGFRWHLGGAQAYFNVIPDLSTFGKAMANGFSLSALVGKKEIMELGGLDHPYKKVFLLSSTNGAETHSLAAALATIKTMKEDKTVEHVWRIGGTLQERFNEISRDLGMLDYVKIEGYPCSPYLVTKDNNLNPSMEYRTLFLQETVNMKVLLPWIAISQSHGESELEATLEACTSALQLYKIALDTGDPLSMIRGPIVKPVFREYN